MIAPLVDLEDDSDNEDIWTNISNNDNTTANNTNNIDNDNTTNNDNNNTNNEIPFRETSWEEHQRRQRSIRTLMMFLMMLILMEGDNPPDGSNSSHNNRKKMLRARKKARDKSRLEKVVHADVYEERRTLDGLLGSVIRMTTSITTPNNSKDGDDESESASASSKGGYTYVQDRYERIVDLNQGVDEDSNAIKYANDYWLDIITAAKEKLGDEKDASGKDEKGGANVSVVEKSKPGEKGTKGSGTHVSSSSRALNGEAESASVQKAKELYETVIEEDKLVWAYPRNATGSYRGEWQRFYNSTDANTPVSSMISPPDLLKDKSTNVADEARTSRKLDEQNVETDSSVDSPSANNTKILSNQEIAALMPQKLHIGLHLLPPSMQSQVKPPREKQNSTKTNEEVSSEKKTSQVEEDLASFGITTPLPIEVTNEKGTAVIRLYSRPIVGMNELSLLDGIVNLYDVNDRSFTSQMKHLTLRVRGVNIHALGKISLVANDGPLRSVFVVKNEYKKNDTTLRRQLAHVQNKDVDSNINVEAVRDEALEIYSHLFSPEVGGDHWRRHLQSQDADDQDRTDDLIRDFSIRSEEVLNPTQTEYIGPNPFLPDDDTGKLLKTPQNVMKATPPLVTLNGHDCEFELDFNVTETQLTVGDYRKMYRKVVHRNLENLESNLDNGEKDRLTVRGNMKTDGMEEALAMQLLGTIRSPQCSFSANLNVTAVRTDWEQTTNKSVNYCFIMMVACLAQTVFLLKQLMHSQPQSAAVRVSLISVGWHTLLDAILCVEHAFLCLLLTPVSTAFGMVAFLKLLIFCVIEMKYMVIVMQAQYNAAGQPLSASELRKKISNLHFRFYCTLIVSIILLWHYKDSYRTLCLLMMYSFWVPQIIKNIQTEAKRPLHIKYVYGMSITRLIAPIYTLAIPKNLFTEIEPEFPVDYFACQMLILWVGFQTAILVGQSKYGTRFMIPARFLPPKFDYNRPIPEHMRPKVSRIQTSSDSDDSESSTLLENEVLTFGDVGPRNRKDKRRNGSGESNGITTINHTEAYERPTLSCVICYNDIDIGDRMEYMLAPCNHIFHRQCLTQWMDVKMECPVCRTNLPAL